MDFFNNIAKSVADTASNIAKVVINVKPAEVNGKIQPIDNKVIVKNKNNHAIARKIPKSVNTAEGFGF